MEKEKIKEILEKTIEISRIENIPLEKVESIVINILEKRNKEKLSESDKVYIKELLLYKYKNSEKIKISSLDELKDLESLKPIISEIKLQGIGKKQTIQEFFKPLAPGIDITLMDLTNTAFEIADTGLGTFLKNKVKVNEIKKEKLYPFEIEENKVRDFLEKELNKASNSIFNDLKGNVEKVVEETKEDFSKINGEILKKNPSVDIDWKDVANSSIKKVVKSNSKNIENSIELSPNEEKFIENMQKIIDKLLNK